MPLALMDGFAAKPAALFSGTGDVTASVAQARAMKMAALCHIFEGAGESVYVLLLPHLKDSVDYRRIRFLANMEVK